MTTRSAENRMSLIVAVVSGAVAALGWCVGISNLRDGWDLRTSDPGRGVMCVPYSPDSAAMYCDGIPTWIFETGSGILMILVAVFASIQAVITTLACVFDARQEPASAASRMASSEGGSAAAACGGASTDGGSEGAASGGGGVL